MDRHSIDALLAKPAKEYANFVAEFIDGMDPATRALTAVAYQNLIPTISGLHRAMKDKGGEYPIESLMYDLSDQARSSNDEISSRRFHWFLFAAILDRMEKVARAEPSVIPQAAIVWTIIATEYPRLKILLPHNMVWSESEKEWFDLTQTDSKLIEDAVNHHIPLAFAEHQAVRQFCESLQLFYWPSKSRIGFVP